MGYSRDTFYRFQELYPAYGQLRAANELKKQGIILSPGEHAPSGFATTWTLSRSV